MSTSDDTTTADAPNGEAPNGDAQNPDAAPRAARRKKTSTTSFGTSSRESHDASAFYSRFVPPTISDDETVVAPHDRPFTDQIFLGAAQDLLTDDTLIRDNSVGLVVTSPPYFVGKTYEEAMGQGHVPAEYDEHLAMLHEVFGLCVNKLEPGGRIAVNVANLGRKPYRSQAADIVRIFEDLGLLIRGEIIWKKGEGMNSSTAWGSFQKPSNPVFRDLTERVIVASKGRFDRAISSKHREQRGLPCEGSITKEAFMRDTKDVWDILPESAKKVGHPAPFPIALPGRLIELFTYRGDLVLDPYMGSGSTAVAAMRTERNYVGCETDADFLASAEARLAAEVERLKENEIRRSQFKVVVPAVKGGDDEALGDDYQARAVRQGQKAETIAEELLNNCGFTQIVKNRKLRCGVEIDFEARDRQDNVWHFDVTGAFTSERAGLRRTDSLWKSLGKAAVRQHDETVKDTGVRYVLLTTALPSGGVGDRALRTARENGVIFDALEMFDESAVSRLVDFGSGSFGPDADVPDYLGAAEPDSLF